MNNVELRWLKKKVGSAYTAETARVLQYRERIPAPPPPPPGRVVRDGKSKSTPIPPSDTTPPAAPPRWTEWFDVPEVSE